MAEMTYIAFELPWTPIVDAMESAKTEYFTRGDLVRLTGLEPRDVSRRLRAALDAGKVEKEGRFWKLKGIFLAWETHEKVGAAIMNAMAIPMYLMADPEQADKPPGAITIKDDGHLQVTTDEEGNVLNIEDSPSRRRK